MSSPGVESKDKPDITMLGTRIAYENRWMRVREDTIRRRDGSESIYGVVDKANFALVIPLDTGNRLHLVEQYRYPVGARSREFPQGAWEQKPDAAALDVARGELMEETGLRAAEMRLVGHLYQACGFASQSYHVWPRLA